MICPHWESRRLTGETGMIGWWAMLVGLCAASGRSRDVLALREVHFGSCATTETYRQLREAAESIDDWPTVRKRAHARLRELIPARGVYTADVLASILLDESEFVAAWKIVDEHPCYEATVLAVTEERAKTHPAEAIEVYRPMVTGCIAMMNKV